MMQNDSIAKDAKNQLTYRMHKFEKKFRRLGQVISAPRIFNLNMQVGYFCWH